MPELSLDDIEAEFAALPGSAGERYRPDSEFEAALRVEAIKAMHSLLDAQPDLRARFAWVAEPNAFASGLEAWLQHEVIEATRAVPREPEHKPVVVRVRAGATEDVEPVDAPQCWFVLLHPRLLFAHGELLASMRVVELQCGEAYDGENPWRVTDQIGGGKLENLARSEDIGLGFAYSQVINWIERMESDEPRDLGLVSDWLPSVAGPVLHLERIEARKPPEMQVEHLVRAPLRFAAFHGWGTFLTHVFDDRPSDGFWPLSAADVQGQHRLLALDERVRIHGVERRFFFGRAGPSIGMAVYLQLVRARTILAARAEAVRLLCLPSASDQQPTLRRRSATEAQLRLFNASTHVFANAADEDLATLGIAAYDEMQVFTGLVAATTLISLGATAFLDRLCARNWGATRRLLERGMDI